MILVVAPHTSWKDIIIGFVTRDQLKIKDAKFLGKKELFDGPFGFMFRWLGGVPVDRSSNKGMVEQVAKLFCENENFLLGMSPEGTRKKVDKLRSGFYHIAKLAQVPILPVGFDYEKKQIIIGESFFTGEDEQADLSKLIQFYSTIKGAHPHLDLRHMKS